MVTRNVRQISRYLPYSDGQLSLTPPPQAERRI